MKADKLERHKKLLGLPTGEEEEKKNKKKTLEAEEE